VDGRLFSLLFLREISKGEFFLRFVLYKTTVTTEFR